MKKKFRILAVRSFVLAVAVFLLTFFVYHYVTPEMGITTVFQKEPGKPLITQLLGNLGVLFLFSGIVNLLIAKIFFPEEGENRGKNI